MGSWKVTNQEIKNDLSFRDPSFPGIKRVIMHTAFANSFTIRYFFFNFCFKFWCWLPVAMAYGHTQRRINCRRVLNTLRLSFETARVSLSVQEERVRGWFTGPRTFNDLASCFMLSGRVQIIGSKLKGRRGLVRNLTEVLPIMRKLNYLHLCAPS